MKKTEHNKQSKNLRATVKYYEQLLASSIARYGNDHKEVIHERSLLGESYRKLGEYDSSVEHLVAALNSRIKTLGKHAREVQYSRDSLASTFQAMGTFKSALAQYAKVRASISRTEPQRHEYLARNLSSIGQTWQAAGKFDRARKYYNLAMEHSKRASYHHHPDVTDCHTLIANSWFEQGDYGNTLVYYDKVLTEYRGRSRTAHPCMVYALEKVGETYFAKGEHRRALDHLGEALHIAKELVAKEPETVERVRQLIADVERDYGSHATDPYHRLKATEQDRIKGVYPRVYISSNYPGLHDIKEELSDYIWSQDREPVFSEKFIPLAQQTFPTTESCIQQVGGANYLVLIIASRGNLAAAKTGQTQEMSLAEQAERTMVKEYEAAVRDKLPTLIIIDEPVAVALNTYREHQGNLKLSYLHVCSNKILETIEHFKSQDKQPHLFKFMQPDHITHWVTAMVQNPWAGMPVKYVPVK